MAKQEIIDELFKVSDAVQKKLIEISKTPIKEWSDKTAGIGEGLAYASQIILDHIKNLIK